MHQGPSLYSAILTSLIQGSHKRNRLDLFMITQCVFTASFSTSRIFCDWKWFWKEISCCHCSFYLIFRSNNKSEQRFVNDSFEKWLPILPGVLQGSVIGPIAYVIYILFIQYWSSISELILFVYGNIFDRINVAKLPKKSKYLNYSQKPQMLDWAAIIFI